MFQLFYQGKSIVNDVHNFTFYFPGIEKSIKKYSPAIYAREQDNLYAFFFLGAAQYIQILQCQACADGYAGYGIFRNVGWQACAFAD